MKDGTQKGDGEIYMFRVDWNLANNHYEAIQPAISAASPGDTINVAAGTYDVATLITVNQAVTITGPGSGGAIVRGTTPDDIKIFKIVTSDVTIKNLEITVASLGAYNSLVSELDNSLVGISGSALSNVSIENNVLYVPLQSGPMSGWNARAITVGDSSSANVIINNNTIYNVRNGIVVRTGNTATVVNNIIFNTKGGIMNYTSSQGDANNRTVTGNSWASTVSGVISHNEWDIVWNTAYYVPDYQQSVVGMSSSNNDAYVLDRRAADKTACDNLTGNRSHIFVDAASSVSIAHPAKGNFNEPFSSISLGVDAVVPGGTINVLAGTYDVDASWDGARCIYINKDLTLVGAGSGLTILDAEHTYSCVNGPPCGPHCTVIWNGALDVTMSGLTVKGGDWGIRNIANGMSATFNDVVVTGNYGHGFVFDNNSVDAVTFNNCKADANGDRGIYFSPGCTATNVSLNNTNADGNKHIGFNCQGSIANLIISGGTFNNNAGGYTNYNCDTQKGPYYGFGIELVDCVGTIDGVTVQDNGRDAAAPAEKGAGINIKGASSDVAIIDSTLDGNPIGLWLENWDGNQPSPAAVAINNSNVVGNTDFGVKNDCTGVTVDATSNWWGASDGPSGVGPGSGDAVSANVDYDPWLVRESSTASATGTGTVTFAVDDGFITGLTAVAEGTLPTAGKPAGVSFPHGLFSFNIIGITPGSTVTVTITYPSAIPVGTQYWKCQGGVWVNCTSLLGDDDGDNVLTLTLTDGGLGDADGFADGTIVDPGGPGVAIGGGGVFGGGGGGGGLLAASACSLTLTANMQGNIATVSMTKDGVLCATCVAKDTAGRYRLEIDKNAKVMLAGNIVPLLLRFSEASTMPQAPENTVIVGSVYEFNAYASTSSTTPSPITISPPARLILTYDPDKLPKNASEVFIANYDTEKGWLALAPVPGVVAEIDRAYGMVSHFTPFAVLAKLGGPAPAKFNVGSLTVTPSQAKLNQEVVISVNVANNGGTSGSYSLELKVNGISESTKQVTVAAGASQTVNFTITKAQPGTYTVDIAGQRGSFVVLGAGTPLSGGLIAIVIAGVLILATVVVLLVTFRRRAY